MVRSIIQFCHKAEDQEDYMEKLEQHLDNGEDIDFIFMHKSMEGSILHHSIEEGFDKVVRYVLSKGADIMKQIYVNSTYFSKHLSALELAALKVNEYGQSNSIQIFYDLQEKCVELYSSFGLTPLHINSAIKKKYWKSNQLEQYLQTIDVNSTPTAESPLWAEMTPLFIAATFRNEDLIKNLLDFGATPVIRDAQGNTPLHHLSHYCDKRLFILDGTDTFGPLTGKTHFHIACVNCPDTLDIVKTYLEQGICPNFETKGRVVKTGLHIAGKVMFCPKLIELLIHYGAEVNRKDGYGSTALKSIIKVFVPKQEWMDSLCNLFEAGATVGASEMDEFKFMIVGWRHNDLCRDFYPAFYRCVKKILMVNSNFVCKNVKDCFDKLLNEFEYPNATEYSDLCTEELNAIHRRGLREVLEDGDIKSDFKEKFVNLMNSNDLQVYPIYRNLLKFRIRQKLIKYEEKKQKVCKAIPLLQAVFKNFGSLPHLCCYEILWNLNIEEIDVVLNLSKS